GEAVTFATFFASQAALSGSAVPRAGLGDPGVLRTVVFSGAYLTLIGLLGVGLGAIVRHTGAAIGILFGLMFVPPLVLGVLGSAGLQIAKFTPLIILANSVGVVTPTPGCLSAWPGLGVIALYAAVALGFLIAAQVAIVLFLVLAPRIARRLGALHRYLAGRLLGVTIPAPRPPRRRVVLRDGPGWRATLYLVLKLPLAVLEAYPVFCWAVGLVNLTYPFWWRLFRNHPPDV